jgi:DNA-binding LytR/AlgR family response regulator
MPDESPHPVLFIYQQVALIRARQRRLPVHSPAERQSMIQIALVEDEAAERDLLSGYIQRFAREQQVELKLTVFNDGIGVTSPYTGEYDIIFMDIQMQYQDGLATARKIRESDEEVILIFITNFAQYAINGYSVGAANFVLKPISYFAFSEELKNALGKLEKKRKATILLHGETGFQRVKLNDILYVETIGRVLALHTRERVFRVNDTLSNLEKQLDDPRFFRCHRCYLINLYYVDGLKDSDILIHQVSLPLSRYKRKEFEDALMYVMGEMI